MDVPSSRSANIVVEATLGAFQPPSRRALVPLLLYKAVFLGDWYQAVAAEERDAEAKDRLLRIGLETLRETVELLKTMREWEENASQTDWDSLAETLQRHALHDLLELKSGSNEAVLLAAMRAPSAALRQRLVELADVDRHHADHLRGLLDAPPAGNLARRRASERGQDWGAHAGRARGSTLGVEIQRALSVIGEGPPRPLRLVLSPHAMRHLRDEGRVTPEGNAFGLPVDVDFGWRGECFAILTDERLRLSELLTQG